MGLRRLLRRRLFVHPVALVAVVVAVLMAMTVVATLRLLSGDIADASVRTSLDVPENERSVAVSAYLKPSEIQGADTVIRDGLRAALGEVPVSRVAYLTSRGIAGRATSDRAQLAEVDGLERSTTLTTGRWPVAASAEAMRGSAVAEVAVPQSTANELGITAGSTLALTNLIDDTLAPFRVVITGTYAPTRADAALWLDDPLSREGVRRSEFTTYGPFVLGPGSLAHGEDTALTWTWRGVAGSPVDVAALDRARQQLTISGAALERAIGAGDGSQKSKEAAATHLLRNATVIDQVLPLYDAAGSVAQRVRIALLTPTLLLLLLGAAALVVAAGLLASVRASETALLRTRGASGRQLALIAGADAGLMVAVGGIGAAMAAPLLARWIGARSGLSASDTPWATVLRSPALWGALGAMGLMAALVIAVTTLRVGRAPGAPGRSPRGGRALQALTGSGLDVLLVLLGILGVVQLRRYAVSAPSAVDPLTVAAPTLVIAGLAVLCLRLLPVLVRLAARMTESRTGLDLAWGGWQVARRLTEQSGTVLLILLALAMGTLALAQGATTTRAIEDQSAFQAGSALRVDTSSAMWADPGVGGLMAEAAGENARVMPVHRATVDLGPLTDVTLLALDAATAGRIVSPRADTVDGGSWAELAQGLAAGRDLGGGVDLPGSPAAVAVDLTLASSTPVPGGMLFPVKVHIRDGRGLVHVLLAGGVSLGSSTVTASLPTGVGTLEAPLALVGILVEGPPGAQWLMQDQALRLDVTAARADGAALSALDTLLPQSSSTSVARMVPANRHPLPALVTDEVAAATRTRVGDTFSLALGSTSLSLRVAAVITSFPAARTPQRAIVVDLPSVMAASAGKGTAQRQVSVPPVQEWWLDPTDPVAAAARLAPGLAEGSDVVSRSGLVAERLRNPVNNGLRSAMALVTAAALVLAAVGFAATTAALSRTRRHENAILLALGVSAARIRRTLALERVVLVVLTVLTGLILGLAAAYTVVPLIVSGDGHPQVPSVAVAFSWPGLVALVVGSIVVLSLVGLLVLRGSSRDLARELREGTE